MHLPLAEEVDDDVIMNPNFKAIFDKKFVNKMSRVIIACQDGGRRSEIAAEMVTGMGYTAIAVVEGGVEAYLKVSPLKEADLRPRVKRVQQEVGIKYGGTGVTSEQTPGAFVLRRRIRMLLRCFDTRADARRRARQTTARKRCWTRGAPMRLLWCVMPAPVGRTAVSNAPRKPRHGR